MTQASGVRRRMDERARPRIDSLPFRRDRDGAGPTISKGGQHLT